MKKREDNETLKTRCISHLLVDMHHLIGGQTNVMKYLECTVDSIENYEYMQNIIKVNLLM